MCLLLLLLSLLLLVCENPQDEAKDDGPELEVSYGFEYQEPRFRVSGFRVQDLESRVWGFRI